MKHFKKLSFLRAAAAVLALTLFFVFVGCSQKDSSSEALGENNIIANATEGIDSATEPADATQLETVPASMGTVTISQLVIREDAGAEYAHVGMYDKGERVEIQETKTVGTAVWGRTGRGWISMNYVRMDGMGASSGNTVLESNGNFGVLGYGVVNLAELNVRSGPGTDHDKVAVVKKGARYAYYEELDGWVRIEDGWVTTSYFYIEGTNAEITSIGTVISNDLNIRTGPSTDFQSIGNYKKDETVDILAQIDGWGYTGKGWVNMMHVELQEPTYAIGTATVTSIRLNIRKEPNADAEETGLYTKGDVVTILEVKNGWGRTDQGWINLIYVKYE